MTTLNEIGDEEYNRLHESLKFSMRWEGGYVNDPDDSGGATKWGVTQKTYNRWRQKKGLEVRHVRDLEPQEAASIYYEDYWLPSGATSLPLPLCTVVLDSAIHCGVSRATGWLQSAKGDVRQYLAQRRDFYLKLASTRPKDKKFLNGWLNRLNDLTKYVEMKRAP